MSRARCRQAHSTRLATLSRDQRGAITYGNRRAFPTATDWQATYDAVKGALLEELDDPATQFHGFWLHEPGLPDDVRRDVHCYGHVLAPDPEAAEAEYEATIAARRAWLRKQGER